MAAASLSSAFEKKTVRKEISSTIYFDGYVTKEICSKLIVEMVKQLLYQREQLPLPFDQMKRTLENESENVNKPTNSNFETSALHGTRNEPIDSSIPKKVKLINPTRLQRISQLKQVFNSLSELSNQLANALLNAENKVTEILLLLGPTLATPREMYLIVLPSDRSSVREPATLRKCMTRVFREMITNCTLWDGGSLGPTNANVLLKMARIPYVADGLIPELGFTIPKRSSRLVRFDLCDRTPPTNEDGANALANQLEEMSLRESADSDECYMWVKLKQSVKGLKVKSVGQSLNL